MFKDILANAHEITDYIIEHSTDLVDVDLIKEYFFGCKAVLKKANLNLLAIQDKNHHIRCLKKESKYINMPIENIPPIIVEDNTILDGHHRFRIAQKLKQKEILMYEIQEVI